MLSYVWSIPTEIVVNDFPFRAKRKMKEILSKYQNLKEVTPSEEEKGRFCL
jgi:hypothetical protein